VGSKPLTAAVNAAISVINYVARSSELLLIDDVEVSNFQTDPHYGNSKRKSISVICAPVKFNNKLRGSVFGRFDHVYG